MARILLVGIDDVSLSEINSNVTPKIHEFRQTAYEPLGFSHPVCSQSRQALNFGCWGKKIGTWKAIGALEPTENTPPASLPTLPQVLRDAGYATALVGKWHCGPETTGAHWALAPLERGYAHWAAGTRLNIAPGTYTDWQRVDADAGGFVVSESESQHAALAQLEAAGAWWEGHPKGPAFLHVALNLPHGPLHVPPSSLLAGWTVPPLPSARQKFLAMLRAADTCFGEFLELVGEDTSVILYSDNGTASNVVAGNVDPDHAKTTTFDPGTRVVMLGRWPGCPEGPADDLNHLVDIPAAVCAIGGVAMPSSWDSQTGGRQYVLLEAEDEDGNLDRACRTKTHKLRQVTPAGEAMSEEFYGLVKDPGETTPLSLTDPVNEAALKWLRGKLEAAEL